MTSTEWDRSASEDRARALSARYAGRPAPDIVRGVVTGDFRDRIAVVTSFGSESAILLHMVAQADKATPVVFIDTGMLFNETLEYRNTLVDLLGFVDVRTVRPDNERVEELDPCGTLWSANPDGCCVVRKVDPPHRELEQFDAWFTGRKAYHGEVRLSLEVFEAVDGRVKINPLARADADDIRAYYRRYDLPFHPLVSEGFPSIGCRPCTDRVAPGEPLRAGRWRGQQKTECGIHARPRSGA